MELMIGKRRIIVDTQRTRAYYEAHPLTEKTDIIARNFDAYMRRALDDQAKAFLGELGVLHFGTLRYKGWHQHPTEHQLFLHSAVFPVFGSVETIAAESDVDVRVPPPLRMMMAMTAFFHAGNFEITYQPPWMTWEAVWKPEDVPEDMLLLHHVSPCPDWVLETPCPTPPPPRDGGARCAEMAQLDIMLHILGDRWEPCPEDRWERVIRAFLDSYVPGKRRAKAEEQIYHENENAQSNVRYASFLWDAFCPENVPVYREGAEADARYNAQRCERFLLFMDRVGLPVYSVEGALPSAEALARFRYVDLYVLPESLDWIYARDHENYGPFFVAR